MLDKNYGDRTQDVFRNMPVFIPIWWGHYDPGFGKVSPKPAGAPILYGWWQAAYQELDFAASIATGVQTFSSKVVGNINDFTSSITSVTNPPPKVSTSTYKGGGGLVVVTAVSALVHAPVLDVLVLVQVVVARFIAQLLYGEQLNLNYRKIKNQGNWRNSPLFPKPGLFHFDYQENGERSRVHLRIDQDGSGLLLVNASRVMHLNPTAALMTYLILQKTPQELAVNSLAKTFNVAADRTN